MPNYVPIRSAIHVHNLFRQSGMHFMVQFLQKHMKNHRKKNFSSLNLPLIDFREKKSFSIPNTPQGFALFFPLKFVFWGGHYPALCTLHSAPCTLHHAPCSLQPAPCSLRLATSTLLPAPCSLHFPAFDKTCTLNPAQNHMHPAPCS